MLKIKLSLMSAAIILGVAGAAASKESALCEAQDQYYKWGSSYFYAGTYGVDYICQFSGGTCTYYQPNPFNPNSFAPCRTGTFTWLSPVNK